MFLHERQTYSNVQTFKKPISNAKHSNLETRIHQNLYLVWSPFIGESLNTQMEVDNVHDKYAVKVLKNQAVVGHVPREISRYCSFGLNSGGTMDAIVTGARENRRGTVKIQTEWTKDIFIKSRIYNQRYCQSKTNKFMKILLHHFPPKLKYALVYMPTGPIPGYKSMGL